MFWKCSADTQKKTCFLEEFLEEIWYTAPNPMLGLEPKSS
jgi:hypothetical protein